MCLVWVVYGIDVGVLKNASHGFSWFPLPHLLNVLNGLVLAVEYGLTFCMCALKIPQENLLLTEEGK